MKGSGTLKVCIIVAILFVLCPTMALGDLSVVLYDNFDDGNYDGWEVGDHLGHVAGPPLVVSSPEGFAITGPFPSVAITHPLTVTNTSEFSFEMRATSGGGDDNFSILLWNEFDYPMGRYYEGVPYRGSALFAFRDEGGIEHLFSYGGGSITGWHDFKWARDAKGWWSFYLDGSNVYSNFVQDSWLTSFLAVSITDFDEQVEWVRVSAAPVPLPGAVLLGAVGVGFANCLLRRSRKNMQP